MMTLSICAFKNINAHPESHHPKVKPGIRVYVSFNKVDQTMTTRPNRKVYGYYVPMRTVLKDVFLLFMFRTKGFQ